MVRFLICLVLFFSISNEGFGRIRSIADSCIQVYYTKPGLTLDEKCNLLNQYLQNCWNDDSCFHYANLLIGHAEELNDPYYSFYGYLQKGQSLFFLGKSEDATTYLLQSLEIALKNNMQKEAGFSYFTLSTVYNRRKNRENATLYLERAITCFEIEDNQKYLASSLFQMGNIYYSTREYDKALDYYKKAKVEFEAINNRASLASSIAQIGFIQSKHQLYDSARYNLHKAIEIFSEEGDFQSLVTNYVFSSLNELKDNRLDAALEDVQKAYYYNLKINNLDKTIDVLNQLKLVFEAKGDYKKAYDYQEQYYVLKDSLNNLDVVTRLANMRTDFEVGQKQAEVDKLSALNSLTQRVAVIIAGSLLVVLLLLLIIYRDYRKKKTLNKELKKQKEELSIRKRELEQVNNSKDRLFSIISHDLRGPVGALGNLAHMISSSLPEGSDTVEANELAISMAEASQQVDFLLNNLLHWSINKQNLYHPKTEPLELIALIRNVMKVYIQTAKAKKIRLSFEPSYKTLRIDGDSNCWGTIIRNLINNSLKFTHVGGKVGLNVIYVDDHVHLEVTDTGVGMTEDQKIKLFKFTGTSREWGTQNERGQGLGLCLVHDFVAINKGLIEVDSEPGKGSTFRIIMPARLIEAESI